MAALTLAIVLGTLMRSSPTSGQEQPPLPPPGVPEPPAACSYDNPQIRGPLKDRAREIVAARTGALPEEVCIVNAAEANYPWLQQTAYRFKVIDQHGELQYVLLGGDGTEQDADALEAQDYEARLAKYGRLDPELWEYLRSAPPEEPVDVFIWVNEPEGADEDPPEPGENASDEAWAAFDEALEAQLAAGAQAATAPVVARLVQLGMDLHPEADPYAPIIDAALTPDALNQVAQWPEVNVVYAAYQDYQPLLAISRKDVQADVVEGLGFNGNGIKVAVVDIGGKIASTNPNLTGVVQSATPGSCLSDHTAGVAGIIRSTHAVTRGVAPGAQLWIGGYCGGGTITPTPAPTKLAKELKKRSNAAVKWKADAINLSWGAPPAPTDTGKPDGLVAYYDRVALRLRRTVVVAAGDSPSSTVANPGRGYNVITVGSADDRNTSDHRAALRTICAVVNTGLGQPHMMLTLAINISPVAHSVHSDQLLIVVDSVDDTIVTYTKAICALHSREHLRLRRQWFISESGHAVQDTGYHRGWNWAQVAFDRRPKFQFVGHYRPRRRFSSSRLIVPSSLRSAISAKS